MRGDLIIAYDIGTTGNKAVLFSTEGMILHSTFHAYDTHFIRQGWVEQNPDAWWQSVCGATKELIETSGITPGEVAGVVFSGQMMGCVFVDMQGAVLRPAIIWADQRGTVEVGQQIEKIGFERIYQITGHRPSASYSAAKAMWVRNNEPEVFSRTYKLLHAKDYIAMKLTGEFATDYSDASGMNLFDLKRLCWSDELLDACGIGKHLLPEVYPSATVVGKVKRDAAEATGLLAGTPVVIGGGDGPCAAAGAGTVREGVAYGYIGSSSWIGVATPEPIMDPEMKIFNWVHVAPGMYSPTGTMQAGGASFQWFRNEVVAASLKTVGVNRDVPYKELDRLAEGVPPGSDGLLYLPYLLGERSPHWDTDARGAFIGLTVNHSLSHMTRAVLEGVAFNLKTILDAFRVNGADVKEIRLIGGGAKSNVWAGIFADIFGVPVVRPTLLDEATSIGAAMTGAVALGLRNDFFAAERMFENAARMEVNPANSKLYNKLYESFCSAYGRLKTLFPELQ